MKTKTKRQFMLLAGMAAWLLISVSVRAVSVSLAWDAPGTYTDGTPLTDLSGYRLYHGVASGVYDDHIDLINTTVATFSNLQSGCSNFFAVTAVNNSGSESEFSEEIVVYVPPIIVISTNTLEVQEGASATFRVWLDAAPVGPTTVLVSRVSGGNINLGTVSGSVLVFSPSNWSSNQIVTLSALYDSTKTNRTAVFQLFGVGLSSTMISASSVGATQSSTEILDGNDIDANGIPDVWEINAFGGIGIQGAAADDDSDHDGVSNAQEYIAGTDPADPASRLLINIRANEGRIEVSFHARETTGAGYMGKMRFYTLERCTNLLGSVWENVPDGTDILASGQAFNYVETFPSMRDCFYRVKARLL